jgi:hypothetical protein
VTFIRTAEIDSIETERSYVGLDGGGQGYLLRENLSRIESALDDDRPALPQGKGELSPEVSYPPLRGSYPQIYGWAQSRCTEQKPADISAGAFSPARDGASHADRKGIRLRFPDGGAALGLFLAPGCPPPVMIEALSDSTQVSAS